MKKQKKRGKEISETILVILILLILFAMIIIVMKVASRVSRDGSGDINKREEFVQVLDDGTKLNTSTRLRKTKIVDGLKFENIQLTTKQGQSVLLADVENDTGKDIDVMLLDIILLDKNGNELTTIGGIIGELKDGEKQLLDSSVASDYANAYDFKVIIK